MDCKRNGKPRGCSGIDCVDIQRGVMHGEVVQGNSLE